MLATSRPPSMIQVSALTMLTRLICPTDLQGCMSDSSYLTQLVVLVAVVSKQLKRAGINIATLSKDATTTAKESLYATQRTLEEVGEAAQPIERGAHKDAPQLGEDPGATLSDARSQEVHVVACDDVSMVSIMNV